jgi:molybdopterin-guanine dinucleotide biosynthesis adapter protein
MNALLHRPPVLGIAAWSGTGKTTLLVKILPLLRAQGLRVGVLKHAHHEFDIDHPGKDSYELRKAGAGQMLIASSQRWALMVEAPVPGDVPLWEMLARLDRDALDLILVEGFRHERFPKLELYRAALGKPLLFPDDDAIIALASDTPVNTALPLLDLDDPAAIAAFIADFCRNDMDPTGL